MEILQIHSRPTRLMYLWSGIIATIAYRIIIVLNNLGQVWVQVSWYIGTIGFIIYFIHRYQVARHRRAVINNYELTAKIANLKEMSDIDKQALTYVLNSVEVSKEKWNDIVIFVTSGLALAAGIYLDFLR